MNEPQQEEGYSILFYVMLAIGIVGVVGFLLLGGAMGVPW